ncbi:hypothetical protein EDEG_02457 [Edhazardia aedis USNM 41457]|uniref:Transmembrane protein n=1 Tax=Edhazardia aedis (strain USNM 41457) TaxID=1003232 RepID=J9DP89_EDHAE|nr:hypothetical protein EDEG_02457 [Edhazardia aedis USNM 41457]|eukprot:EJW03152.1 hypothetical protein EDEG_02457 [Edhazardia aedis USNM 41457]
MEIKKSFGRSMQFERLLDTEIIRQEQEEQQQTISISNSNTETISNENSQASALNIENGQKTLILGEEEQETAKNYVNNLVLINRCSTVFLNVLISEFFGINNVFWWICSGIVIFSIFSIYIYFLVNLEMRGIKNLKIYKKKIFCGIFS